MKIVAEHDKEIGFRCNQCHKVFPMDKARLAPDSIVWCPYCFNYLPYSVIEKFPNEKKEVKVITPRTMDTQTS